MKKIIKNTYRFAKKIPYMGRGATFLRDAYNNSFLKKRSLFAADKKRAHEVLTLFWGASSPAHAYLDNFIRSPFFKTEFSYGHSGNFDIMMLYSVARIIQPRVVIETGVASGRSSMAILHALAENKKGMLYSIDLPQFYDTKLPEKYITEEGNTELRGFVPSGKEPGWLVPEELRPRWKLILGDSNKELPLLLEKLDMADIFYHDGDHSYKTMFGEFESLWPRLPKGGFLFSDDVKWNDAWKDFMKSKTAFTSLAYRNFGIIRK